MGPPKCTESGVGWGWGIPKEEGEMGVGRGEVALSAMAFFKPGPWLGSIRAWDCEEALGEG